MSNTYDKVKSSGTSKLVRAKFGPGMLLQHEDLEQLNSYTRDLSRLMFRSLFGCGVVCGLVVTVDPKSGNITVGAGLALDCNGDPVHLPKDETFPLGDDCKPIPDELRELWLVLCGTTKCCAPRTAMCASDDDEPTSASTREWDGYEIRVTSKRPTCVCSCLKPANYKEERGEVFDCNKNHLAGSCGCNCDECSDCDCKCILLARLNRTGDSVQWSVDYGVRRFIRPVLMHDPEPKGPAQSHQQPSNAMEGEQRQTQPATEENAELEQLKAAIASLKEKLKNVDKEKTDVAEKLMSVAQEKEVLDQQMEDANESKRLAIQRLQNALDGKVQAEQKLLDMTKRMANQKRAQQKPATAKKAAKKAVKKKV